jgi:hypothetical protein
MFNVFVLANVENKILEIKDIGDILLKPQNTKHPLSI